MQDEQIRRGSARSAPGAARAGRLNGAAREGRCGTGKAGGGGGQGSAGSRRRVTARAGCDHHFEWVVACMWPAALMVHVPTGSHH